MSKENKPLTIGELEKRKKNKTISVVIGIISAGILGSMAYTFYGFWQMSKQIAKQEPPKPKIVEEDKIRKGWKEITEERITEIEDNQRKIAEVLNKLKKDQNDLYKKLQNIEKKLGEISIKTSSYSSSTTTKPKTNHKASSTQPKEKLEEIAPPPKTYRTDFREKLQKTSPKGEKKQPELIKFTPEETSQVETTEEEKPKIKIPIGFVRGITLTGLDAPTFQWGVNNPHPILISIQDKEILANNKRLNIKACFVLGSGYGEVSSERAYIRLVKISCITKDNGLIEEKVKGWIVDDDGKIGLKGRLVTKQGAYLAKSLVAGFLSGVTKILQAGAQTVSVSPLGTTATFNPSQAGKVGIFAGASNAMDRLAKFYEKMAEQIFPVIEITPGRKVAVLFEGGDNLKEKTKVNLNPLGGK